MKHNEWLTIPVLPYVSLDDTLAFWQSLGFVLTYRQRSPYPYAVVARNGSQLHFVHQKPAGDTGYHGCLIMIHDVAAVHSGFCNNLKASMGKVPATGLPRISRMKPGQTRFTVTDPSGNSVIYIQYGKEDEEQYEKAAQKDLSKPAKAIALAARLRDFKEDYAAAARALDNVLKQNMATPEELAEVLIMRAGLALVLNDNTTEATCLAQLADLQITPEKIQELQLKHTWQD